MAHESLSHKEGKGSTAKWFVIAMVPILHLYWFWKAAETVSGHGKRVLKEYEALEHSGKKESTVKWSCIFLIPVISMDLVVALDASCGIGTAVAPGIAAVAPGIATFAVAIYVLYKMAVIVSGHETWHPEECEAVKHKEKRDSTAKWFAFGIIPILNLYFAWKMSEAISGHETVYK